MRLQTLIRLLWTLLSLPPAFLILALVMGSAAWNGVNFVVGLYLALSAAGLVGIVLGLYAAFSRRRLLLWIVASGGVAIAVLSLIFAFGFIFHRARGIPLGDPLGFGHFEVPILAIYGMALVCCSIEALLFCPRNMSARNS